MTMKYMDEFRDAELGRALAGKILGAVEPGRHYKVMEVCGGHTHSIYKYGIDDMLPENVELVHGPAARLRDPDGPRRRRDRDGHRERHHLHLLRAT
jgi:hydrogenase expression/formation protein HypD